MSAKRTPPKGLPPSTDVPRALPRGREATRLLSARCQRCASAPPNPTEHSSAPGSWYTRGGIRETEAREVPSAPFLHCPYPAEPSAAGTGHGRYSSVVWRSHPGASGASQGSAFLLCQRCGEAVGNGLDDEGSGKRRAAESTTSCRALSSPGDVMGRLGAGQS